MKHKTLGSFLEDIKKLSPEQLKKPLTYISEDLCIRGFVKGFEIADDDLYKYEENYPNELMPKSILYEDGYSEEDVSKMNIEVYKGDLVIKL